jgi:hypothetical protein
VVSNVTRTDRLRVRNASEAEVVFVLEPWGQQCPMAAGATFEVVARGPEGDGLEVDFGEGTVTVYGWTGSLVTVYDGRRIVADGDHPPPATPPRFPAR